MRDRVRASFDSLFQTLEARLEERDEPHHIRVQVGSATCENAAGSDAAREAFERSIEASGRTDVRVVQTGCTGRCGREPIVGVMVPGEMPVQYEEVDGEKAHRIFVEHIQKGRPFVEPADGPREAAPRYDIIFCRSAQCDHMRDHDVGQLIRERLAARGVQQHRARVVDANCFGLCRHETPGPSGHVLIRPVNVVYKIRSEEDVDELIDRQIGRDEIVEHLKVEQAPLSERFFQLYGGASFLYRQSRIALRNSGLIDPEDLAEYVHFNGFEALVNVLSEDDPHALIELIGRSNLRGRGGAGYPTFQKWRFGRDSLSDEKFVICNADEGDPGAFMDRSMLEGDPYSVLEGLVIAGYAIGASRGFFYIRAEYPLAISRIEKAIEVCREYGLLGKNILDSGFDFDVEVRLGAGAFVCGEETALIASIEGHRGQPRVRPPYPTDVGLWGKPTVINNVETLANVPAIVLYGADWFSRVGTKRSGGTKVFALSGKVRDTGLVEVPMGTSLREIVFGIGGGLARSRDLKAIQTGGPAGGCIPASKIDTPVDFDTLSAEGAMMGSGGMIVMDEDDCMVGIARFFMAFSQDESCGKCTPCREGTTRMLEILDRLVEGRGAPIDLVNLERLAKLVGKASLCGLGRAAPNPVLSTLHHFGHEYEAHVKDKACPAGRCPMKPVRAPAPLAEEPILEAPGLLPSRDDGDGGPPEKPDVGPDGRQPREEAPSR